MLCIVALCIPVALGKPRPTMTKPQVFKYLISNPFNKSTSQIGALYSLVRFCFFSV